MLRWKYSFTGQTAVQVGGRVLSVDASGFLDDPPECCLSALQESPHFQQVEAPLPELPKTKKR